MDSTIFRIEKQHQLNQAFKSQNPEILDTVFEIEGKKIYADKIRLSNISTTFESMLSDRWTSKDEAIKIECYKFEDFEQLLAFIFSGKCKITDENVFHMLDMAEFYQINTLKQFCGKYLSRMKYSVDNIFQLIDTSSNYALAEMKNPIQSFIVKNFSAFVKCDGFLTLDKTFLKDIVTWKYYYFNPEEIFQAVFRWCENQAMKKEEETRDKYFNVKDAIKVEITEFLPYIQFKTMEISFLQKCVAKKGYIFSNGELNDIIQAVRFNLKKVENDRIYNELYSVRPSFYY